MEASRRRHRVYHVWKGNNRFFCDGRFMSGPDWRNAVVTALVIVVPASVFASTTGVDLMQELGNWPALAVPLLSALSILLLGATSLSDPGVIPRSPKPAPRVPKRVQDVLVDGRLVRIKWCETCSIFRPPRCSHCSVCDNCCEMMDHHCPFLGNCIGKRNYRSFVLFLMVSTALSGLVLSLSIVHLATFPEKLRAGNPISLVLVVYCFAAFWFVLGLFSFHIYLLVQGTTTNEKMKQSFLEGNPFSKGALLNAASFACTLPPKRNFRPRQSLEAAQSAPAMAPSSSLSVPVSDRSTQPIRGDNEECSSSEVCLDERRPGVQRLGHTEFNADGRVYTALSLGAPLKLYSDSPDQDSAAIQLA